MTPTTTLANSYTLTIDDAELSFLHHATLQVRARARRGLRRNCRRCQHRFDAAHAMHQRLLYLRAHRKD